MHKNKVNVMCDICKKVLSYKINLRYHMFSHFPEEYLTCKSCKKTCKSLPSLKKHLRQCNKFKETHLLKTSLAETQLVTLNNQTLYHCDLCKKNFYSKNGMKEHMFSHFPEEYLTCKGCYIKCKTNAKYRKHLRDCEQVKRRKTLNLINSSLRCELCQKNFISPNGLKEHIFSHFPKEYLTCTGCQNTFKTVTLYRKHLHSCKKPGRNKAVISNENVLKCELCKKNFYTKAGLRQHIYSHFPEEFYTCKVCRLTSKNLRTYRKHMHDCNALKRNKIVFKCDLCEKKLYRKSGLREHIYAHFPQDYLTCRGCKSVCPNVTLFRKHVSNCNNVKNKKLFLNRKVFKCELCRKKFCNLYGIRRHIYSHFPEEYLTCKDCKTSCKTVWLFRKHVRDCDYVEEKVFYKNSRECDLCRKNFRSKNGLRNHMFAHFPDEYLSCKGCGKLCKSYNLLKKHWLACNKIKKKEKLATNNYVYKCDSCGKDFFSKRRRKFFDSHQERYTCRGCKKASKRKPPVLKLPKGSNKVMLKFECPYCDQIVRGYSELSLKKHMNEHVKIERQKRNIMIRSSTSALDQLVNKTFMYPLTMPPRTFFIRPDIHAHTSSYASTHSVQYRPEFNFENVSNPPNYHPHFNFQNVANTLNYDPQFNFDRRPDPNQSLVLDIEIKEEVV